MDMQQTFKTDWTNVGDLPQAEVLDRIVTGVKDKEHFTYDVWAAQAINIKLPDARMILDFGAGMLRNTVGFLKHNPQWHVMAYDNLSMLARGQQLFADELKPDWERVGFCDDWTVVREIKFDAVYASLVFQHIEEAALRQYLQDLREMTSLLLVHGRSTFDDIKTLVWPVILETWKPVAEGAGWEDKLLASQPEQHWFVRFMPR